MDDLLHHNQPPEMSITAGEVAKDLSNWMSEHPFIDTEDNAREAKLFVDRGSLCLKDMEDERKGKVTPLNEQVRTINELYRPSRDLLTGVLDELKYRLDGFIIAEEKKRIAAAKEAARLAQEAEQAARLAEQQEQECIQDASRGLLDVDVAAAISTADDAFSAYQKAERQAALAERETKVKIGGGFRRSLSLRSHEVLGVNDIHAAIEDIGKGNATITAAVLMAARAFKKINNRYPRGIGVHIERKT